MGGGRGLVFLVSVLVCFCLYFSVLLSNHPRSIVNTAVFGAIYLSFALMFQASIYKLRYTYLESFPLIPSLTLCFPS